MNTVKLDVELPSHNALALAQFCKRVSWQEMRDNAVDENETYDIKFAIEIIQNALARAGYAPR